MKNDWILDVLNDLQKFSAANKLGRLADYLDDTIMMAATELSSTPALPAKVVNLREQIGESVDACIPGHRA